MSLTKPFPLMLAVCFASSLLATNVSAQTTARPRQTSNPVQLTARTIVRGATRLENDVVVALPDPTAEDEPDAVEIAPVMPEHIGRPERMLLSAIEERLGTPYRMGATGPNRYDCSGFVWSVYQSAGINFERATAHTLWNEFAPATEDEKHKFGTLVFFNNVRHVGIVADENGFYHASSSHGVVYSRFNDYWLKRIAGFRRVPLPQATPMIASAGR
ncbi:MAG: C40 family peptidase [Acidobacteria bacterium]|nr:C40 family peptidase [Acidobacteriota bacterium]